MVSTGYLPMKPTTENIWKIRVFRRNDGDGKSVFYINRIRDEKAGIFPFF